MLTGVPIITFEIIGNTDKTLNLEFYNTFILLRSKTKTIRIKTNKTRDRTFRKY